ncbi:hypothetical protein L9F63_003729, partial [Diploptera punctata]
VVECFVLFFAIPAHLLISVYFDSPGFEQALLVSGILLRNRVYCLFYLSRKSEYGLSLTGIRVACCPGRSRKT